LPAGIINVAGAIVDGEHFIYLFVDEAKFATLLRVARHAFDPELVLTPEDAEKLCDRIDAMC